MPAVLDIEPTVTFSSVIMANWLYKITGFTFIQKLSRSLSAVNLAKTKTISFVKKGQ